MASARRALAERQKGGGGSIYHGVAETGIPFQDIAGLIGQKLSVPTLSADAKRAAKHFGMLSMFVGLDNPATSEQTRDKLGWTPEREGLLADMVQSYF